MTSHNRLRRRLAALCTSLIVILALAGCTMDEIKRGWLPTQRGMTNHTDRMWDLWVGTWIVAWIVGGITWGLMFWCMIVYRRRRGQTGLPVQLRYHMPIEIMFTVIPVFMVGVLFFYTARDMAIINHVDEDKPDAVDIQVIGKRWAWDFNYLDDKVYDTSEQVGMDGTDAPLKEVPILYLPVNRPITLHIDSRDVDHSFWVPAFLYKRDMIPGLHNTYQFTPQIVGEYDGKCAELCGEYHSEMIFKVAVVPQAEYDQKMAEFRAKGQTGELALELGRWDGPERNAVGENAHGGE